MAESLGDIKGQMILDVKQALAAYTQTRQMHISTVTALQTGAGAATAAGAAVAGVGVAMVAGFGVAINAAAEFERKLDFFNAVAVTTGNELDEVREKALQLGADTIYSADQIADSFIELGKSGVSARDIIDGIGEGVASLGAAADIPLDTAANIITAAVATFNLGADQAVMVADKLAGAANASIIDVQDLGVSLKYVGGVASALGVPFEDVNTALGILGENGIKGSTAGTSLRQVLLGLNGTTDKAKTALRELGIITEDGTNKFYNMDGSAKSLAEVFQILQDATAGMSDQQKVATFQQIFATRALPSLIALTKEGAAGFQEMADAINSTTALEVASKRLDNLSGDLEILRGNIDTLLIEAGGGFQNFARMIVQGVTGIIQVFLDLPSWLQTTIVAFIALSGAGLILIGTLGMMSGAILNLIALGIRLAPVLAVLTPLVRAFFAAFLTNPIFIVIAAVIALAAALGIFFTQTETGAAAFQNLVNGITTAFNAVAAKIQELLPVVIGFVTTMIAKIIEVAPTIIPAALALMSNLLNTIIGFLPQLIPAIIMLVTTIITTLVGMIPDLIRGATALFVGLLEALTVILPVLIQGVTDMIVLLITSIAGILPMLITAGINLFTGLLTALITVLPLILNAIVALIPIIINALVTALPLLIDGALQLFMGILMALVTAIPIIITALVDAIPLIIDALVDAVPLIIDAAIELFLGIITALVTAIPQIITALVESIPLILLALVDALPKLIDAAITLFLGIITGLLEALPQIIDALIKAVPKIVQALIDAAPKFLDAGVKLIQGLIDGIGKMGGALLKAVQKIAEGAINGIKNFFGIRSPSRVFAEIGQYLIQGLINGVDDMERGAVAAMEGVANAVSNVQFANDGLSSFYDQVAAARDLESGLITSGAGLGVENTQLITMNALLDKMNKGDLGKTVIYETEVNNPVAEPASDSIPKALRAAAFTAGDDT